MRPLEVLYSRDSRATRPQRDSRIFSYAGLAQTLEAASERTRAHRRPIAVWRRLSLSLSLSVVHTAIPMCTLERVVEKATSRIVPSPRDRSSSNSSSRFNTEFPSLFDSYRWGAGAHEREREKARDDADALGRELAQARVEAAQQRRAWEREQAAVLSLKRTRVIVRLVCVSLAVI